MLGGVGIASHGGLVSRFIQSVGEPWSMHRRSFLAVTVSTVLAGCAGNISQEGGSPTPTPSDDVQYLGLHEAHESYDIENVQYDVWGPCKSYVTVNLAESPPEDESAVTVLHIVGYDGDEPVEEWKHEVGTGTDGGDSYDIDTCIVNFDGFKIAILDHEDSE